MAAPAAAVRAGAVGDGDSGLETKIAASAMAPAAAPAVARAAAALAPSPEDAREALSKAVDAAALPSRVACVAAWILAGLGLALIAGALFCFVAVDLTVGLAFLLAALIAGIAAKNLFPSTPVPLNEDQFKQLLASGDEDLMQRYGYNRTELDLRALGCEPALTLGDVETLLMDSFDQVFAGDKERREKAKLMLEADFKISNRRTTVINADAFGDVYRTIFNTVVELSREPGEGGRQQEGQQSGWQKIGGRLFQAQNDAQRHEIRYPLPMDNVTKMIAASPSLRTIHLGKFISQETVEACARCPVEELTMQGETMPIVKKMVAVIIRIPTLTKLTLRGNDKAKLEEMCDKATLDLIRSRFVHDKDKGVWSRKP